MVSPSTLRVALGWQPYPSAVTWSGQKPVVARAERKNPFAALMSSCQTVEDLRQALLVFRDTHNTTWLIQRQDFQTSAAIRQQQQLQPVALVAQAPIRCPISQGRYTATLPKHTAPIPRSRIRSVPGLDLLPVRRVVYPRKR